MVLFKLALVPAIASLACAESTITSLFAPGLTGRQVEASIINNDATATTYSLNCHRPADIQHCALGLTNNVTAVQAGDAVTWWNNPQEDFTMTMECTPDGTIKATCTATRGPGGYGPTGTHRYVFSKSLEYMSIVITAGSIAPVETSASPTTTGSDAQATDTNSDATPTGAAPKVTGAGLALGLGAAVIGAVL